MDLDHVTTMLGQFGPYQRRKYLMICMFATVSALHALNMVFVGAEQNFRCSLPGDGVLSNSSEHLTFAQRERFYLPPGESCLQYDVTERLVQWEEQGYNMTSFLMTSSGNGSKVECRAGYNYSTEIYSTTITSAFDLVCENRYWRSISKSVFFAGRLAGAIIFGQLSDRFGRRPMFFVGVLLLLVAGCVAASAPSMSVFLPMYFTQGAAHTGTFLVSFTLATELVGRKYRVVAGYVIQVFYGLGYVLLAGLGYFIRDWRHLELAITLPAILFGFYWWYLPESVPWLLSRERDAEAEAILQNVARQNGVTLKDDVISALKSNAAMKGGHRQYYVMDCLRSWRMARISLIVWFNWFANAFVFYGLSLNSENLSGNPYLNFCLVGGVDILSYLTLLALGDRLGRRGPLIGFMCLGGVACCLAGFVVDKEEQGFKTAVVVLVVFGKYCIAASYAVIYLMGAELFPTVVRNIGMGVASMSARVGGIFAPFVLDLKELWASLPLMVFGGISVGAGLLALLLDDTAGRPLPQTLADITRRPQKHKKAEPNKKLSIVEEEELKDLA